MRCLPAAIILAIALAWTCGSTRAEEGELLTGTLKTINDRGTILIGYRDSALPFSFLNKAGQPVGFSLDSCHDIAAGIACTPKLHNLLQADAADLAKRGMRLVLCTCRRSERLQRIVLGALRSGVWLDDGRTPDAARTVTFSPYFLPRGHPSSIVPSGGQDVLQFPPIMT